MKSFALRRRALLNVGITLLVTGCVSPSGVTPLASNETAPAPAVTVGDQWTYRISDAYTGIERGTERYQIEQVSGSRINVAVTRQGTGTDEIEHYDGHWNWLKRSATNLPVFEYSPVYPAFDFPLLPGKTWQGRLGATDPTDGRRFPVLVEAKVLGWERVKVPAGEFDAIKVQRIVYFNYWIQGLRGRSEITELEWYAPKIKQSVRRETNSRYWSELGAVSNGFVQVKGGGRGDGGPRFLQDNWLLAELVSYSVR